MGGRHCEGRESDREGGVVRRKRWGRRGGGGRERG